MTELTREDLHHRRDHFTAIGSADRAAYDMALRTYDAEKRAERAERRRREIDDEAYEYAERLQKAEAENARLRSLLSQWSGDWHDGLSGGPSGDLIHDTDEALATPPEGGTCHECHGTGEICAGGNPADSGTWHPCPVCDGDGIGSQQPEDAMAADALAAFDRLCNDYDVADDDEYYFIRRQLTTETPCPHARTSDGGTSYCTLAETGSAVPYVPDGWRHRMERIRDLIASAPEDALGTGTADDCPPWPIRDEVVHEITKLLAAAPTKGGTE